MFVVVILVVYALSAFSDESDNDTSIDEEEIFDQVEVNEKYTPELKKIEEIPTETVGEDDQEEIETLDKKISNNPENPDSYIKKSELQFISGNIDGALDTINKGLENNPNNQNLLSKKDVLEKEWLSASDSETPRN